MLDVLREKNNTKEIEMKINSSLAYEKSKYAKIVFILQQPLNW